MTSAERDGRLDDRVDAEGDQPTDDGDDEDAVLHEAARDVDATAIVTRSGGDFKSATLPVFDPQELLAAVVAASE